MEDTSSLFKFLNKASADKNHLKTVICLYNATGTQVQVNGHLSEEILMKRGVR